MRTISRPRGRNGDLAVAIVTLIVTLVMSAGAAQPGDRSLWPGGVALIVLSSAVLVVRRRHPVLVLVVVTVATPLYYPMGYPDGPIALVFLIALFNAAVECRLPVSLWAVIAINAGFVGVGVLRGDGTPPQDPSAVVDAESVAGLSVLLLVTVAMGQYVRGRRAQLRAAEQRAAEAERDREQEARRRATEERLRIARELHDVLAHQISLINVQAGAALHRRDDPEQAYASLEAIKAASKETLRELRGVLGVLRQVDEGPGASSPVAPAPSLAGLSALLEGTRASGLVVRRRGEAGDAELACRVAPPASLAGYRIVQEALTNVVRHARAETVTVTVRCADGSVIVEIVDDGTGPADPAALERGNGLRGMRERAAAVGGEVTAGPAPGGGFRVRARLPAVDALGRGEGSAGGGPAADAGETTEVGVDRSMRDRAGDGA